MKIALAQLNFIVGDFDYNKRKIRDYIAKAKSAEADLIVFSELSICGYPAGDFLDYGHFVARCHEVALELAQDCNGIAAIIGCPVSNPNPKGKPLYNAALVLADGAVLTAVFKTLLPNYDVFDECRFFEPNTAFNTVDLSAGKLAVTICEDLWAVGENQLYAVRPMDHLIRQHPEIIINISASPFNYNQFTSRRQVFSTNARNYGLPLVYVNQAGANNDLIFDGDSMVLDACGNIVAEAGRFCESLIMVDTCCLNKQVETTPPSRVELIHDALVMGVRDYFHKMGLKKAIIGLSGGIDSAVVLVLAIRALGPQNVTSLLLPSGFSTRHSVDDALALLQNTGSPYEIIDINQNYNAFIETLAPHFGNLPFDVTEENLQARIRAVILMAFANKFGFILLNTSNKSEAAVGYGTLYGDMCGGLSVLGDVYKTQIYELADYINRHQVVIPEAIIAKPPSAELRPNQLDSDSLPEYAILDQILNLYIENRLGADQIMAQGFDAATVRDVLRMVNINEWKRFQSPPALRVSPKAFGTGRRMPIVAKHFGKP